MVEIREQVVSPIRLIVLWLSLCFLASCSTSLQVPPSAESGLANHSSLYQVSWHNNEASVARFLLVLEHQADSMSFIGMSHAGMTLFVLQRDKRSERLQVTPFARLEYSPSKLLNQVLVAEYEEVFLQEILPKNWQIKSTNAGKQVFKQNQLIWSVERLPESSFRINDGEQRFELQLLSQELLH